LTSDAPLPLMHEGEVPIDQDLVGALIADQYPTWAHLPLERMASTGTDNAIFRLGTEFGVRLPRIGWAVEQVTKERHWLPRLAPYLPAAVPEPVAVGKPSHGYPWPWLIYRWIDGTDTMAGEGLAQPEVVEAVAKFILALQAVDTEGAPPPGARGGSLQAVDAETRQAIAVLADEIDVDAALAVWDAALAAPEWTYPHVWVHGDLLPGNVIVADGSVAGVIDWSAAGVGDPSCDTMLAWAMPPSTRALFRADLGVDDATWARGKGWTLQQAVFFIPYYAGTLPDGVAAARRRLAAVLDDRVS
jgi:aminoglycoside phosphotransferase (APT) family kinase protein